MIKLISSAGAFLCFSLLASASQIDDQLSKIVQGSPAVPLEQTNLGYDLHNDFFYFDDKQVSIAYSRSKYTNTKVTLAGQSEGIGGQRVMDAKLPFAVAQKSNHGFGTNYDRWDVKQDANGNQYHALYHGAKGHFVVNKLRGHLLRRVVNAVQDLLPALDLVTKTQDKEENTATIIETVTSAISNAVKSVDSEIRDSMDKSDDTSSTVSLVIVTKENVIVLNIGGGRVIAHDTDFETTLLSEDNIVTTTCATIGSNKSRPYSCSPQVKIHPRVSLDEDGDEKSLQFVVIESPLLVGQISNNEAVTKLVTLQMSQHKGYEQEIFSSAVTKLVQTASEGLTPIAKINSPDLSVMLIGLDKDYENVH